MTEFLIGDHTYRAGHLDPMRQLHVVRRLTPVLTSLGAAAEGFGVGAEDGKVINPFAGLSPVADVLAGMADKDVEYVVNTCLSVAQRKDGETWRPVMANGVVMYSADLDLPALLQITWEVGKANLSGFTRTFQSLGLVTKKA